MKILLLGEYSGLNNELKSALIKAGHQVTLAAANDFFKKFPVDINLGFGSNIYLYSASRFILPLIKLYGFTGYDIVHVINFYLIPRVPLANLMLIKFLKDNNGIVTLSGAGDDPFFVRHSENVLRYSPIPAHEEFDRKKSYYMRSKSDYEMMLRYMSYVDGVIPIMYEYYATFVAAGFEDKTSLPIPIPIDCGGIEMKENEIGDRLVFFHGLNRPGFKGTFLIAKAFEKLSKKYASDVECIIKGKMSFKEYMVVLGKTNISVDQVFSYSLAMNALYSMARGKIVCGGAENESLILYGCDSVPAFNLLPDVESIYDVLLELLDRRDEINTLSLESRNFILNHHNPIKVAEKYCNFWSGL